MIAVKKINNFIKSLSTVKFIFTILACTYIMIIPIIPLFIALVGNTNAINACTGFEGMSIKETLFLGAILSPIVETFIFQHIIIKVLDKFVHNKILIVVLSAIPFALCHSSGDLVRTINIFFVGALLSYAFIVQNENKLKGHTRISPFWTVVSIYSLRNFISILFTYFMIL